MYLTKMEDSCQNPSIVDHVTEGKYHHLMEDLKHPGRFTQEELDVSLHLAATQLAHVQMTKMLLCHGANIKHLNEKGAPILLGVVLGGHVDILRCLLEFGYDVNYTIGDSSETGIGVPLNIAIWKKDEKMVELLLNSNCGTNFVDTEGNNALLTSCMVGSPTILVMILNASSLPTIDINFQNLHGETGLHLAVKHYNRDCVHKLLTSDTIDINAENQCGDTPLLIAAKLCQIDVIEGFFDCPSCDINHSNNDGSTLLHMIGPYADISLVEKCISCGASLDAVDNYGNTILTISACYNNEPLLQYLMSNLTDHELSRKGFLGRSVLHWIVLNKMTESLALILELKYSDMNILDDEQNTPLMLAVKNRGYNEMVVLLENGADLGMTDVTGYSVVHLVCARGYTDMLLLLLNNHPNINQVAKESETALLLAVKNNHLDIVKLLYHVEDCSNVIDISDTSGNTLLHHAVDNENQEIIQFLLDNGCTRLINCTNNEGNSPLLIASKSNNLTTVKTLIHHGAEVNVVDSDKKSPLYYIVCYGDVETTEFILCTGADPDFDEHESTALIQAIKLGNKVITELLIKHNAKIDRMDTFGRTAFIWACQRDNIAIAELLLLQGCNQKHIDFSGDTALTAAAFEGHLEVVRFLIPISDIDHAEQEEGMGALLLSLSNGHREVSELLLEHGADVNAAGNNGNSVLTTAVAMETGACIVKLILSAGKQKNINRIGELDRAVIHWAISETKVLDVLINSVYEVDLNVVDENGATPLLLAIAHSQSDAAIMLLEANCIHDLVHLDGRQSIHHAAIYGEADVIKFLLEKKGVNVNTLTTDSRSPLLLASIEGNADCVKLFLEAGAAVNEVYFDAITPLSVAVTGSHYQTMELLLKWGAYPDLIGSKKARPLIGSIVKDDIKSVKMLLQWGSDIEECVDINSHPITVASLKNRIDIVSLLLNSLSDTNVVRRILKAGAIYYFILDEGLRGQLQNYVRSPVCLQQNCRTVVRKCTNFSVMSNIALLPIPVMLKEYLFFNKV